MIKILFNYFVFPGFCFLVLAGLIVSWIDRKITARLQWRVGPGLFQPFYDIQKMFVKEIIIPDGGNKSLFIVSPMISLISIMLISNILILTYLSPQAGFIGDIIVVLYLFSVPSVMCILGASASANPYASLGASREMKSILSYELPFIISLLVPIIKTKSISLGKIISCQQADSSFVYEASGFLAFIVSILCFQAKMGIAPFDMAEAETELAGGSVVEYSGPLLALWKISKMMLLVTGPLFLAIVFWGGGNVLWIFVKYALILTIIILMKNTNPRLRIDQSVKLFWSVITIISFTAMLLAVWDF